ncbi:MAG: type IV pilus assembly protein PilM, partial [Candidatus Edwardsbacteria bacterium]
MTFSIFFGIIKYVMLSLFAKRFIGLDIGSSSVKLAEITVHKGQITVTKLASFPIKKLSKRDTTQHGQPITDALSHLFAQEGIRERRVISDLSGVYVVSRSFTFPAMSQEELQKFIRKNAEDYIPAKTSIKQVDIDFQVLREEMKGGEETAEVLIAVAKKEAVKEHIQTLSDAGLCPVIIDASSLSLLNAFVFHPFTTKGKCAAIIDLGAEKTKILIISDAILRFVIETSIGGNEINKHLKRKLKLNPEEIERLKENLTDISDLGKTIIFNSHLYRTSTIRKTLSSAYEKISSEIEKVFTYYQKTNPSSPRIQSIILTGGSAVAYGLSEVIHQKLNVEVQIPNPLDNLKLNVPLPKNPGVYSLALGLALKKVYPYINTIDLLPETVAKEIKQKREKELVRKISSTSGVVCAGMLSF